jgi:predicted Zn-dependent protease
MLKFKNYTRDLFPLILAFYFTGCSQLTSINMYSTDEEIKLGRGYSFQIEKQLQLIYDPLINNYINNLGQRLVSVSKRKNIKYTFKVVNDPAINAFALPGGYCYVNLGLIEFADTEAELASVIGHEIGHVVGEHGMENMTKQNIIGLAGAIALGSSPSFGEEFMASLIQTGIITNYGRAAELEADKLGIQQMHDAGINPNGSKEFFKKLAREEKEGSNRMSRILSTHPPTSIRIKKATTIIKSLAYKEYDDLTTKNFQGLKDYLLKIKK